MEDINFQKVDGMIDLSLVKYLTKGAIDKKATKILINVDEVTLSMGHSTAKRLFEAFLESRTPNKKICLVIEGDTFKFVTFEQ